MTCFNQFRQTQLTHSSFRCFIKVADFMWWMEHTWVHDCTVLVILAIVLMTLLVGWMLQSRVDHPRVFKLNITEIKIALIGLYLLRPYLSWHNCFILCMFDWHCSAGNDDWIGRSDLGGFVGFEWSELVWLGVMFHCCGHCALLFPLGRFILDV